MKGKPTLSEAFLGKNKTWLCQSVSRWNLFAEGKRTVLRKPPSKPGSKHFRPILELQEAETKGCTNKKKDKSVVTRSLDSELCCTR